MLQFQFLRCTVAANVLAVLGLTAFAAEPSPTTAPQAAASSNVAAVGKLVSAMDSQSFAVREAAMGELRALVFDHGEPADALLAELFRRSLDPDLSFEAQQRLAVIIDGVELPDSLRSDVVTEKDIADLIRQLSGDRFTARETASRRLGWMLRNRANIVPSLLALKALLADSKLSAATRQGLEKHYDTARRAWLLAPPGECRLPAVSDEGIAAFVALVAAPAERPGAIADQRFAVREVQDLLCRDEYRDKTSAQLKSALESATDPLIAARLRDLVDLTLPSLVAEIWTAERFVNLGGGFFVADEEQIRIRLATTQYLHVGVPQTPENAPRPTFFDRCDDKTAHCVSGNTLHPGDYPVGTAILHPEGESTLFHLINLPTPRRRLIYEYSAANSEVVRFRTLSQNTCNAYLTKSRPLTDTDISILILLDRAVVAQFAGRFFETVEDAPFDKQGRGPIGGQSSLHNAICYALAFTGTREAAMSILEALEKKRILPADKSRNYDLPRIALLSIARRDPWNTVDNWLGAQLSEKRPLMTNVDPAPELAATAAAILLERNGESLDSYGIELLQEGLCQQVRLPTYRFRDEAARQSVIRWWLARREVESADAR